MIATIHQPEHLPWLGFFNKIDQADVLVLLDVVQFRKNYFQNRNRIYGPTGPRWLTVPVLTKGHSDQRISDVTIDHRSPWPRKHRTTLEQTYCRHPHFDMLAAALEDAYSREWTHLSQLNETIIATLIQLLGIEVKLCRASDLGPAGGGTELLRDLCVAVGADTYLAGQSARDYLKDDLFNEVGIEVKHHTFAHPIYPQNHASRFLSHLSVVDLIANAGTQSLEIIRSGS